ncbi:hypothetical protein Tco_0599530 [Tanacetum coccineum]
MIAPESSQEILNELPKYYQHMTLSSLHILYYDSSISNICLSSWIRRGSELVVGSWVLEVVVDEQQVAHMFVVEDTIVVDEQLALVDRTVKDNLIKMVKFRRTSLIGFPTQSVRSSNADSVDSPYFLVLNTRTSQSRQHDMTESDSYYLPD